MLISIHTWKCHFNTISCFDHWSFDFGVDESWISTFGFHQIWITNSGRKVDSYRKSFQESGIEKLPESELLIVGTHISKTLQKIGRTSSHWEISLSHGLIILCPVSTIQHSLLNWISVSVSRIQNESYRERALTVVYHLIIRYNSRNEKVYKYVIWFSEHKL